MKTIYKTENGRALFIITELDPAHQAATANLGFTQTSEGFVKSFPAEAPHLERTYQNFERYGEAMILQTAQVQPVPWEQSLSAFLAATAGQGINWWLVGSTALAVRGLDIAPRDLDIATDSAGAQRLGELLLDFLVEPVVDCSKEWISDWGGRAFLHARLEWVGDVHADVDQPHPADFGPAAAQRLERVTWRRNEIRVPPLDLQLAVNERRGLTERVEKIKDFNKKIRANS